MPEREHHPEAQLETLRQAVDVGITQALQTIRVRYENAPDPRDRLSYHNTDHTQGVVHRTETILRALREVNPELVAERDIEIGRLAGGFHDIVHSHRPGQNVGESERASVAEAVSFMHEQNEQLGYVLFNADDERLVSESIDGTVPAFDKKLGTTIQPNVRDSSSIVTRALALADLGVAGMEGPESFQLTSDALFRERNIDIFDALQSNQPVVQDTQQEFRRRMLAWVESQSKFVVGRKAVFSEGIAYFSPAGQEALRTLFSHFDKSIAGSTESFRRRKEMSFTELARDMGYSV